MVRCTKNLMKEVIQSFAILPHARLLKSIFFRHLSFRETWRNNKTRWSYRENNFERDWPIRSHGVFSICQNISCMYWLGLFPLLALSAYKRLVTFKCQLLFWGKWLNVFSANASKENLSKRACKNEEASNWLTNISKYRLIVVWGWKNTDIVIQILYSVHHQKLTVCNQVFVAQ